MTWASATLADDYWKAPYPVRGRIIDPNPARPWEGNEQAPKQSLKQKEQQSQPQSVGAWGIPLTATTDEAAEYERQRKEQWEKGTRDYRMPTFPVAPEGTEYTYLPFEDRVVLPANSDYFQIVAYTQIPMKVKWLWVKPQDGVKVIQVKYGCMAAGTGAGQFDTTLFEYALLPAFGDIDIGNLATLTLRNMGDIDYLPSAVLIGLQVIQPRGRW